MNVIANEREAIFPLVTSLFVYGRLPPGGPVRRSYSASRSDGNCWLMAVFLLILSNQPTLAQTHTISGYVTDAESGEKLIGASVYLPTLGKGTTTNLYGFYSLPLSGDSATVTFSYIGYARRTETLALRQDTRLDVELSSNTLLEEVEVVATPEENVVDQVQMSVHKIPMQTIEQAPVLGGETDILKTLQLLPGVSFGSEGSAGLYVRGGSPDQNLILLDGVPVYNVNHLFGFLSVFNTDAINNVELIKGGIPARYGGRLSSVLDISMKEGNLKESGGVFAISPIAARFTYESPIKRDTSSFIISARRTWLDVASAVASLLDDRTFGYNFYDVNAKYNHKLNRNNRVYLSFYTGRDRFFDTFNDGTDRYTFNFRWGNLTSVLRWNHIFNPKLFSNISASYSTYNFFQEYRVRQEGTDFFNLSRSRIRDLKLQADFDYAPALSHSIKFGGMLSRQRFEPDVVQVVNASTDTTFNNQTFINSTNIEVYAEDEISITRQLTTNVGLRASGFWVNSEAYTNLQPRLAMRYLVSPSLSVKVSYTYMVQYLHLLTNSSLGLPTDLWVSTTENVAPQRSEQVAAGIAKSLVRNRYDVSLEGYYKRMDNLIAYRDGASFLFQNGETWENKVVAGNGESYGAELFINKKQGKITGWLGYTLSWTYHWFDAIDDGRRFPFRYDRRHDLSLLVNYHLPKDRTLSTTFVYNTGNAVSIPTARYQGIAPPGWEYERFYQQAFDDRLLLDQRNNFRAPAYHRLDISYQRTKLKKKDRQRTWIFSLYNAYNRLNPYFLYEQDGRLKQYSLFPIIPSITYRLEF
ncbi:TonB-dependent receptor [Tunicatimonas pelagia]|uniref:TonB-dependent receptor n=1 Tax=Tunicatimonas pelagia TaxID=931531 RepID=UPI002665D908|nr:TonB-dependent receptor [Tunicatimonas pelagia]WKN44736.1 TonB-dependent receptor [Tunicatimonas pelagia]